MRKTLMSIAERLMLEATFTGCQILSQDINRNKGAQACSFYQI